MSEVCRVDFYLLQDSTQPVELIACQLALKAWEQGNRTLVAAADQAAVTRVDALMWEHPPGRFLPHAAVQQETTAPVLVGTFEQLEALDAEVLINLTPRAVERPQRYARVLELVPAEAELKQASRDKFRAYRSQGLEPATHPVGRS